MFSDKIFDTLPLSWTNKAAEGKARLQRVLFPPVCLRYDRIGLCKWNVGFYCVLDCSSWLYPQQRCVIWIILSFKPEIILTLMQMKWLCHIVILRWDRALFILRDIHVQLLYKVGKSAKRWHIKMATAGATVTELLNGSSQSYEWLYRDYVLYSLRSCLTKTKRDTDALSSGLSANLLHTLVWDWAEKQLSKSTKSKHIQWQNKQG